MSKTNQLTLDQFKELVEGIDKENNSKGQLDDIPADQLRRLRDEIKAVRDEYANLAKRLAGILAGRYGVIGAAKLAEAGKQTGSISFKIDDLPLKYEVESKVEWNQPLLRKAVDKLVVDGENPEEYVKITVEVPEAKYKAWPEKIKNLFKDARTTRHGEPKLDFKE